MTCPKTFKFQLSNLDTLLTAMTKTSAIASWEMQIRILSVGSYVAAARVAIMNDWGTFRAFHVVTATFFLLWDLANRTLSPLFLLCKSYRCSTTAVISHTLICILLASAVSMTIFVGGTAFRIGTKSRAAFFRTIDETFPLAVRSCKFVSALGARNPVKFFQRFPR